MGWSQTTGFQSVLYCPMYCVQYTLAKQCAANHAIKMFCYRILLRCRPMNCYLIIVNRKHAHSNVQGRSNTDEQHIGAALPAKFIKFWFAKKNCDMKEIIAMSAHDDERSPGAWVTGKSMLRSILENKGFLKKSSGLAGGCAASQSNATFENLC